MPEIKFNTFASLLVIEFVSQSRTNSMKNLTSSSDDLWYRKFTTNEPFSCHYFKGTTNGSKMNASFWNTFYYSQFRLRNVSSLLVGGSSPSAFLFWIIFRLFLLPYFQLKLRNFLYQINNFKHDVKTHRK